MDLHTHYDAELEIAPSLSESLRHGVTTALIGSCGLSMVIGEPGNDEPVRAVLVNGRVAWRGGTGSDGLGVSRDYGRVLALGSG